MATEEIIACYLYGEKGKMDLREEGHMKRIVLIALFLVSLREVAAQEAGSIVLGAWVRVQFPLQPAGDSWLVGSVVSLDADTLVLKSKGRPTPLAVPLVSVTRFEVSYEQGLLGERLWEPVPLPIQGTARMPDHPVTISLKDGTALTGKVVGEEEKSFAVVTLADLEVKVPKSSILSIEPVRGQVVGGMLYRSDPNYSRLMYAPTGRPLRQGEGFFSDYYVFFPGISYGITDQVGFMAGMSIFPGVPLEAQLKYVAPRIGVQISDKYAISAGTLYATGGDDGGESFGVAFAVGTIGQKDKSLTAGIGRTYGGEDLESETILMVGGNVRLSNSAALVSENWILPAEDDGRAFGLAIRFFGDRIATDVGLVFIPVVLKEGFPIPWLSFVYNFGD